jgi:DNA transformation protein
MEREEIEELLAPFARVRVRRMFGGKGVYADDLFFALAFGGELYFKADAATQPLFEAAGSTPFSYDRAGKRATISYWRLVPSAYEDDEELRRWATLALEAARRAQAAKAARRRRKKD